MSETHPVGNVKYPWDIQVCPLPHHTVQPSDLNPIPEQAKFLPAQGHDIAVPSARNTSHPNGYITNYVQISGQMSLNQRLLPETQTKDSIRNELGTRWSDFAVTMLHLKKTHTHTLLETQCLQR